MKYNMFEFIKQEIQLKKYQIQANLPKFQSPKLFKGLFG